MRVKVQPTFREATFSLDTEYNATVEQVLVLCSLQVTEVPITEMALFFQGKALLASQRLDQVGVAEGATVELKQRAASPCCLLV